MIRLDLINVDGLKKHTCLDVYVCVFHITICGCVVYVRVYYLNTNRLIEFC